MLRSDTMHALVVLLLACAMFSCGSTTDPGTLGPDSGTGDADGGPLSSCNFVNQLDRGCTSDTDCVVGIHQTDCCGNTAAIGMNRTEARFDALESTCQASYPGCGCASGPTRTDSGETAFDSMSIQVACVSGGPTRSCLTFVTMRPPDAP